MPAEPSELILLSPEGHWSLTADGNPEQFSRCLYGNFGYRIPDALAANFTKDSAPVRLVLMEEHLPALEELLEAAGSGRAESPAYRDELEPLRSVARQLRERRFRVCTMRSLIIAWMGEAIRESGDLFWILVSDQLVQFAARNDSEWRTRSVVWAEPAADALSRELRRTRLLWRLDPMYDAACNWVLIAPPAHVDTLTLGGSSWFRLMQFRELWQKAEKIEYSCGLWAEEQRRRRLALRSVQAALALVALVGRGADASSRSMNQGALPAGDASHTAILENTRLRERLETLRFEQLNNQRVTSLLCDFSNAVADAEPAWLDLVSVERIPAAGSPFGSDDACRIVIKGLVFRADAGEFGRSDCYARTERLLAKLSALSQGGESSASCENTPPYGVRFEFSVEGRADHP